MALRDGENLQRLTISKGGCPYFTIDLEKGDVHIHDYENGLREFFSWMRLFASDHLRQAANAVMKKYGRVLVDLHKASQVLCEAIIFEAPKEAQEAAWSAFRETNDVATALDVLEALHEWNRT